MTSMPIHPLPTTHTNRRAADFDIDVDLSVAVGEELQIDCRWYELACQSRNAQLRRKAEAVLRNALLRAQWLATSRRRLDRRRARRVGVISRVHIADGLPMVATDISVNGLRCAGAPRAPLMNVEFKLPGLAFPVASQVEVVSFRDSPVTPLCGLRFVNLEGPYRGHISEFIGRKQRAA